MIYVAESRYHPHYTQWYERFLLMYLYQFTTLGRECGQSNLYRSRTRLDQDEIRSLARAHAEIHGAKTCMACQGPRRNVVCGKVGGHSRLGLDELTGARLDPDTGVYRNCASLVSSPWCGSDSCLSQVRNSNDKAVMQ